MLNFAAQFAAISAAKCGKFLTYFGHHFRPVTHYGMVIKSWNVAENNRRVIIPTYYEATDTLRGLFLRFGPISSDIRFSKCNSGPGELSKFSYLDQIDLKIAY